MWASLNILKRLGGDENSFGCSFVELAFDGVMNTSSYIWLTPLILGNVFPDESIG
jgi:hypothetical protein